MSILNIFKKKKGKEQRGEERKKPEKEKKLEKKVKKEVKEQKPKLEPKEKKKREKIRESEKTSKREKREKKGISFAALKSPHITEKATDLVEQNKYVFKVFAGANKIEIKKAIEGLYGVDVLSVRIVNVPAKKRRLGRIEGFRRKYKKAIVTIRKDQKIEVLPR